MLYFLLIVIAVGVLLISPAGKKILKWAAIIAVIAAALSAAVLGIMLISEKYGGTWGILAGLALLGLVLRMFGFGQDDKSTG
ncbi:MAG: hypothetical protein PHV99_00280 [Candidatus Pacebacteria bacterium]|nr:hypothetical protein [Candidatus Paceibacterota bacterium]